MGSVKFNNSIQNWSDLSVVKTEVISKQGELQSLFCPFCADEYLFEFSLKDHLKRKHSNELKKNTLSDLPECEQYVNNFECPYCKAVFYNKVLIPKHIFHHHGRNWLQHYQQSLCTIDLEQNKENDITVTYASCSPGLSDVFEKLMTKDFQSMNNLGDLSSDSPKLKSILKKTPNKLYNPILGSPSSVSIRRFRNQLVKRSLSARRELRFDLPPLQKSPQIIRKHRKFVDLLKLFSFRKSTAKTLRVSPIKKQKKTENHPSSKKNMVTSTPVNILDEDNLDKFKHINDSYESTMGYGAINDKTKKKKNYQIKHSLKKFECGNCADKYRSNTDLLLHLKDKHFKTTFLIKKNYKCGRCGEKFYKNKSLIQHTFVHSPSNDIYN